MAQDDIAVIDEPVEGFGFDDLFFSRTDDRGVLLSGNAVFTRLSGYAREELIGAPHKRIRHPDMPRAVFRMMWDDLKAGRSFAGYVKNRSKCGRYYWVLALSLPVNGGYFSVRLKPGEEMVNRIAKLYAEIRRAENRDGQPPEVGVAALEQFARDAGFPDYHEFATEALFREGALRAGKLGHSADPLDHNFAEVRRLMQEMDTTMTAIAGLLRRTRGSPTNLSIQGKRLQTGTETLKVIAQNYSVLSEQIERSVADMQAAMRDMHSAARSGRRGHCAFRLLSEAIPRYVAEPMEGDATARAQEVAFLTAALAQFEASIGAGYGRVGAGVSAFTSVSANLKRVVSGLAMTRVMCRMEAARIHSNVGGIDEINLQLGNFQDLLATALDQITGTCSALSGNMIQISNRDARKRVA